MKNHPIPQLGAATALVQLLEEHPELPTAHWSVGKVVPVLGGHLHDCGMDALDAYASALGGSIRAGQDYMADGEMRRNHVLTSVWRDVRVSILLSLPAPVTSAVSA